MDGVPEFEPHLPGVPFVPGIRIDPHNYPCQAPRYLSAGFLCRGRMRLCWPGIMRCDVCKRIAIPEACFAD